MKTLFLAWQHPDSRAWFPIGRLTYDGELYRFGYIQGVLTAQKRANFQPLWSFPRLDEVYESPHLFSLFANRLLRQSRPDYPDFVQWLNIAQHEDDPIALLARSGGKRATDTLEVFPLPQPDPQGHYHIHFFAHGLSHLPPETQNRIHQLQPQEQLSIIHESQNPYDSNALLLCTSDRYQVGYFPRYYAKDLVNLRDDLTVLVERVNPSPTPLQFRLLCNLTACWPENFQPFSDGDYQPLVWEEQGRDRSYRTLELIALFPQSLE
ncbi:HIRAN domain-containing protein [Desertifilum sp. FACHB-1129]|uniref:DNA-binding protein n=1 Tax=Desertifilum tharense IPPAS B-1220 TaxID=1781255 RepID=A0A1E5QIA9_9CYAN|nr:MULTISPECIES: HIRAN domain-containing protein [Desertifilum]MDA0210015.1 HIRAN domain-containing protein [Cyanobacteria bacterium FC1]MBD2314879.1 HIRAN domain-containing protein [Desertifilum sp. FACHB-1129]MBD2320420.1 HIRAN domain-containing protein [Desertifilum sp. FACHB-866]MBD2330548.1 HIRAN domain-containing protein [Desertifilum sp. FACHB-868]OEJ74358.1 DNA-binding protein [Desertifilum tharense IPPAS B-1220]